MKNTCKRLFSLMLAVVLLVSVVPFQASASDYSVQIGAKYEDGTVIFERRSFEINDESTTVGALAEYKLKREADVTGEVVSYWLKSADANGLTNMDATVSSGDEIVFVIKGKPAGGDDGSTPRTPQSTMSLSA